VVLKPAPQTPLSALALAALAEEAGVPRGLLNIVIGPAGPIATELTANALVRKLTFGGAREIAERLLRDRPAGVGKIAVEHAGRAALLIFEDADIDAAVQGALRSTFRCPDQRGVCTNGLLIQRGIYDAFTTKYIAEVRALKVGPGLDPDTEVGPLIDEAAMRKVERQIADARSQGAALAIGGRQHARGGLFFEPTVLKYTTSRMPTRWDESAGLVVSLIPFSTEAEALAMANQCELGPASYFFTRDVGRVYRVARGLETHVLGVNTGMLSGEDSAFVCPRQSKAGSDGGDDEIRAYLNVKTVCFAETNPQPPLPA
jgi:succinate-semialdehyde dehydrogenase/glutarate-semialdehyde dehydrogenase